MNHYHKSAARMQKDLDTLGDFFKEDGVVKTVFRERIKQELDLAKKLDDELNSKLR